MEATIKTIVFKNGTVVISQIEEVESELGDPNCKLIKPCEIKKEKITEGIYLQNWLSNISPNGADLHLRRRWLAQVFWSARFHISS